LGVPGLAYERDDGGAGVEQVAQVEVVLRTGIRPAGGAEGNQGRALEFHRRHLVEVLRVLGVGPGPAALDVRHAQLVELLRDLQLVELGMTYIEGGRPGSNPKDSQYFHEMTS